MTVSLFVTYELCPRLWSKARHRTAQRDVVADIRNLQSRFIPYSLESPSLSDTGQGSPLGLRPLLPVSPNEATRLETKSRVKSMQVRVYGTTGIFHQSKLTRKIANWYMIIWFNGEPHCQLTRLPGSCRPNRLRNVFWKDSSSVSDRVINYFGSHMEFYVDAGKAHVHFSQVPTPHVEVSVSHATLACYQSLQSTNLPV